MEVFQEVKLSEESLDVDRDVGCAARVSPESVRGQMSAVERLQKIIIIHFLSHSWWVCFDLEESHVASGGLSFLLSQFNLLCRCSFVDRIIVKTVIPTKLIHW